MHMDLFHCREEQCPFEREFIRKVVKEMEVSVTFIVCYFIILLFTYLAYNKSDPVWKKKKYFFGTFLQLKNALKLMQIGLYSIALIW